MAKKTPLQIYILFIILAVLTIGIIVFMLSDHVVSSENTLVNIDGYSFDPSAVRNIDITWLYGTIELQSSDVPQIIVSCDAAIQEPVLNGDRLMVNSPSESSVLLAADPSAVLHITVPKIWMANELSIISQSTGISVDSLLGNQFNVESDSGDILFNRCVLEDVQIQTNSGEVQYIGELTALQCSSGSANCSYVLSNNPSSINVQTVSGDVQVSVLDECGFTLITQLQSGHYSTDFTLEDGSPEVLHGDGGCSVFLHSESGNVQLLQK